MSSTVGTEIDRNLPAAADFAYRLRELLGDASTAILTIAGGPAGMGSCPLLIQSLDESATLWLLSSRRAMATMKIITEHPLALVIIPARTGRHLVLHGRGLRPAEIPYTSATHWPDGLRAWFPRGPEDSNLRLLEIPITGADCWDGLVHRRIEPVPAT